MANDSDLERTEAATPRRLEKARESGQVARSRELSTFLLFGGSAILFSSYGAALMRQLQAAMGAALVISRADAFDRSAMGLHLQRFSLHILADFAPLFVVLIVLAILAALVIGGWMFSTEAFTPDPSRMNPLSGLKRMFSGHGFAELLKAIAKTVVLGALGGWLLWDMRRAVLGLGNQDVVTALSSLGGLLAHAFFWMCGGLALIALGDVPLQILRHSKHLRMTRQEVMDENRDMEGDPRVRARVRALQRAIAKRRMMAAVPTADVVVVNPTHYAVALSYSESMSAPRVVAKGGDLVAQRIREIAKEHRVPILEAPPLARALYRHTEIGQDIPTALYEAVALVMAYVFQLRRFNTQGGAYPLMPTRLPVPGTLDPGVETHE